MIRPRIIPNITIFEGMLYKTQKFEDPIYLGDPHIAVRIFNDLEVDELIVLDFSYEKPNFDLLEDIASEAFMPLVYGGGIRKVEEFDMVIKSGFEKVSLNTMHLEDPETVQKLASRYGSSTLVASVDIKKSFFGKFSIFHKTSKSKRLKENLNEYILYLEKLGFGEILLNIIDNEAQMKGCNLEILGEIPDELRIPLLLQGGVGSVDDIIKALKHNKLSGIVCGAFFVLNGRFKTPLISYLDQEDFTKIISDIQ